MRGRAAARRILLYCFCIGSFCFILLNVEVGRAGEEGRSGEVGLPPPQFTPPGPAGRPWYMEGGQLLPFNTTGSNTTANLFPEYFQWESSLRLRLLQDGTGDRMESQLMFLPPGQQNQLDPDTPLKKVLFWNGAQAWGVRPGRGVFLKEECPVSSCVVSTRRKEAASADLIVFKDHFTMPGLERRPEQLWMMFMLESPLHTQQFKHPAVFNWTATYRADSTLVTPYERWQYYDPAVPARQQTLNFAANKTKKVAWFVSNCAAKNNRLEYARNLSNYIDVDIFGSCGSKRCPRDNQDCSKMLDTDYKFYLAFENSNCVDYITEKFYVNGLQHNVLPIVMGARREDYERSAPHNSFLHVDDFPGGPAELATFLHRLDRDDALYQQFFLWKGTGEMINTKFFCRLCALLHSDKERPVENRNIPDINEWWRGKGTCISGSWAKYRAAKQKTKEKP